MFPTAHSLHLNREGIEAAMDDTTNSRSARNLFSDALSQFSELVRAEFQLARAEMGAKASLVGVAVGFLVAAALLLIPALVLLLMALASFLTEQGISSAAADSIAGVFALLTGAAVGWAGLKKLKPGALVPTRALAQLERDVSAIKEHL
jgi:hypothetical protein